MVADFCISCRFGSAAEQDTREADLINVLSQQIAFLADGIEDPGIHRVRFGAHGLASGVYFYRLRAGEYTGTKRLLVVR